MRKVSTLALVLFVVGCVRSNNEKIETISVVEVPIQTAADHSDLIALMRRTAAANGMHVDDDSQKWIDFQRSHPNVPDDPIDTRASIYVGVWRGSNDEDFEISVSDMTHLGRAWVSFLHDGRYDLPATQREQVLAEIRRRWPGSLSVPVLPWGGEPLAEDLRATAQGYKIAAEAARRYGLPVTSPLLVREQVRRGL